MARIGETVCWNAACKQAGIAVHRSATGKLHSTCHKCGSNVWPVQGTKSHRDLIAQTMLDGDDSPAPAPENKTTPQTPTEPKKPTKGSSVFNLADL